MNLQFMRSNLENEYGLVELQDKILEIAVYIDKFCDEHGIDYCLMGGSALGAKRHGGFIPWDDDLDIFMTPDNYEKFRREFKRSGDHEKFYLQEWGLRKNGEVTIPKLRMNRTAYIEELTKDWDIHQGIYVDIFILHTCPDNKFLQLWQCFWAKCVVMKGLAMREYSRQTGIRRFLINVSKLMPEGLMVSYGLKQVYRFRNHPSKNYCNFLGKVLYKKGLYPRELFCETVKIPFETVKLRVPKGLTKFLTRRFGDYMKIPSKERIKWEQHAWKWDCKKSYEEYMPVGMKHEFKDEKKLV